MQNTRQTEHPPGTEDFCIKLPGLSALVWFWGIVACQQISGVQEHSSTRGEDG